MKNSNDAIGNRTRDLPACRAVPQPTAPPRAPNLAQYLRLCEQEFWTNNLLNLRKQPMQRLV